MNFRDLGQLLLLVALCALPPLSIDMGLPGLPLASTALGVSPNTMALTVTLFMAGFALSPIVYGTLSDRWGRRPFMIAGLLLFTLGGIGCVLAPSIGWLLLSRLLQGAGAGCGPTLAFAASRDQLSGRRLGQRMATLTMLLNTAPVIAPSLGTACLAIGGWRGIYLVLAVCGLLLLVGAARGFAETRTAPPPPHPPLLAGLWHDARILLGRPDVRLPGMLYGCAAASMFAYVAVSPLLLMQGLGASPALYAVLFAATGGGIVLGAFTSGRLMHRIAPMRVIGAGLALQIAGPVAAAVLLLAGVQQTVPVVACMVVATFGYGLVAPAAAHSTLEKVAERAGTAAALMSSFQMTSMAFSSLCASLLFIPLGDLAPSATMLIFALAAASCLYGWWRYQLQVPAAA